MKHLLACVAVLALAACTSTKNSSEGDLDAQGWVQPSALLQQQMDDEAQRLPWTKGLERLEQIRWFVTVGEPAYELLLDLSRDGRPAVSSAAFAALGASGDRRLVDALREQPFDAETASFELRLERARTFVRLGDWSEMPLLIQGLSDERLFTRALCAEALEQATGQTLGFSPRGTDNEREIAVDAWKRWWLKYSGDPLREEPRD
jgi:HEAT repeat protein